MAKESDLKKVIDLLSTWIVRIRSNNAIFLFDINKIAESFCLKLLNLIYGLKLKDLNLEKTNYPGLDLGDELISKVAYQVSSRTDTDKVISTLRTVLKKKYHETFSGGIKFLILSDGVKITFGRIDPKTILPAFNPETDILYIDDLTKAIKIIFDTDEVLFLKIKKLVESDIGIEDTGTNVESTDLLALINGLNEQIEDLKKELNVDFTLNDRPLFVRDLSLPNIPILSDRKIRVAEEIDILTANTLLWITGNVSTGKTQLAILIGKQYVENSYWFDAATIKDEQEFVERIIDELSLALNINRSSTIKNTIKEILKFVGPGSLIILNDLPQLSGKESQKRNFSILIKEAIDAKVNIVVTSNYDSPYSTEYDIFNYIVKYPIPIFSQEETGDVMKFYGANEETIKEEAGLIETLTEGHPLIINAICKYLQEHNWEIDNQAVLTIFKGNFGEDYKAEVYSKIIESSMDENTKRLLYRLSPINGSFSAAEIRAVSNILPEINHPTESIQRLKGIWLKLVDDYKLELSPLVKQMDSNLSDRIENEINTALGDMILSKKLISQTEASTVINYYHKGNAFPKLAIVLILVLQESLKNKELFFKWGFDLYWYYIKLPEEISPFFKVLIRFLQINVALQHKKNIDFLIKDIEEIAGKEDVGQLGKVMKNLVFHHVFSKIEPNKALLNFIEAQEGLANIQMDLPDFPLKDLAQDDFIWISFYKLRSKQEFIDWFATFETVSEKFTANSIYSSQGYIIAGHSLVHLCSALKEELEQGISTLKTIAELSIKLKLPLLTIYSLRYIIRLNAIHSVNLATSMVYVGQFHELIDSEPIYQYLIKEEVGRQLFYAGNRVESLKSLAQIVDIELPEHYIEGLDAYIIFAQLISTSDNSEAHDYMLKGLNKAISDSRTPIMDKIKFYGEAGISFWLVGENIEAINHLEKGFELLLDNFEEIPENQAAIIRFGHVTNYVKGILMDGYPPTKAGDGGEYAIPVRGTFYFSIDKLLEGGFYFDERKFIVTTLFESIFEFLGKYESAKKWALKGIDISLNLSDTKYAPVLMVNTFYLILERNYQKAVNLFLYIEDFLEKLNKSQKTKDDSLLKLALEQNKAWERNEPYYYQYIVVPIVFTIAEDILFEKIHQSDLPSWIDNVFDYLSIDLKDNDTLDFIKQIYCKCLVEKAALAEINILLDNYNGPYKSQVLTVGYILASLDASIFEAAQMQLALIPGIDEVFNNKFRAFYSFCIVPFFINFWQKRFDQNPKRFPQSEFWILKSVPRFKNATLANKLRYLFQALVLHLDIPVSSKIEKWLD
ncbi:MAG: SMEK domain-containing protein [Ginsengibacter sp.]